MNETLYYTGQPFSAPEMNTSLPLHLLSAGMVRFSDTASFELHFPGTYILLYTVAGSARLRIDKQSYHISAQNNNLLFLDCSRHSMLFPASVPWEYQIFHFRSSLTESLFSLSPFPWGFLFHAPVCSDTAVTLNKLAKLSKHPSAHSALKISGHLYQTITSCISDSFSEEPQSTIPDYLLQIHHLFDTEYMEEYTLDSLSELFHVSKYKLCREFHVHFGCSPIQYLNRTRIFASKNLLLDPKCKVYEAGYKVGIENTNHYISLFKKYVGCTPAQFKQNLSFEE